MKPGFKVYDKPCDGCLLSSDRIVSARRAKQILVEVRESGGHFICHKATQRGEDVCCSSWFEARGEESNLIRMARRCNMIVRVEQPEPSETE